MTLFAIHIGAKLAPDKSVPLLWGLDDETKARVDGADLPMLYAFPAYADAEKVMGQVQALFDMDDHRADTLHIVEYEQSS